MSVFTERNRSVSLMSLCSGQYELLTTLMTRLREHISAYNLHVAAPVDHDAYTRMTRMLADRRVQTVQSAVVAIFFRECAVTLGSSRDSAVSGPIPKGTSCPNPVCMCAVRAL